MNLNDTAHEIWAMVQGSQAIEDSAAAIEEKLRSVSAETLRNAAAEMGDHEHVNGAVRELFQRADELESGEQK